tara:strand:+ start:29044 stop:30381 length:1338 start_codon:yes stop_codon:yes gene_type:complete
MLKYTPREQFKPLHNRRQRWAVLNTHRRAGKTVALVNDLIYGGLECKLHNPQLAYIGPTYSQAKKVAWQYLKDFAEPYLSKPPQEAELKVTLKNNATIYCLGADNANTLRGMYLDGCVPDEYALFRPSVFSQVIRPALSDRNGWAIFASTPQGKNLFYDVVQKAKQFPAEWFHLHLPADTSGIIAARELEDLRRDMDPEEFAQEYLCSFDSALKGAIYAAEINSMFLEGRVRPRLYDPELPVYCVFDLGFTDATVCIWFQVARTGPRIVACEATTGTEIGYHIEKIVQFDGTVEAIFLPHDARAKNLQTGKSIVEQFLKEELEVRMIPNHKVRDGISAARKLFPTVTIDSETTGDLVEALKGYRRTWDDNLLKFSDVPLHNWCSDFADCFRYFALACGLLGVVTATKVIKGGERSVMAMLTESEFNLETMFADNELHRADVLRIV